MSLKSSTPGVEGNMRNTPFLVNHYYHVYNRGVDKRLIFLDEGDLWRFYACLFLFNNSNYQSPGGRTQSVIEDARKMAATQSRDCLVKILSFCLLPNHFHLLLEPMIEGGLSQFMHRIAMGYAKYFNQKYERTGTLYESKFKAVTMTREPQFQHISRYIHLNVLDFFGLPWREGLVTNWDEALLCLDEYRWSSHRVFMGKPQALPVVSEDLAAQMYNNAEQYEGFLKGWSTRDAELFRDVYKF